MLSGTTGLTFNGFDTTQMALKQLHNVTAKVVWTVHLPAKPNIFHHVALAPHLNIQVTFTLNK